VRIAILIVATVALPAIAPAQNVPSLQPEMPITIDAESSEFDYESSRLLFRGLRLDQGNLGIRADMAETDKLDFNEGAWTFSGNVRIEADNTTLECDAAELSFRDHQLLAAVLTGAPASFAQPSREPGKINRGSAREIFYEMDAATLRLVGDARFSDGVNEISGDLITYDIARGSLTADSGDSGPVKILIEPPEREAGTATP